MPTDPKHRARDAFADLDTAEKTAFVIEATFSTIGAALRETGQRLGDAITDFDPDAFFRGAPHPPEASGAPAEARRPRAKTATAPKTSTAKKAAAKKAAATKPAASKTAPKTKPAPKAAGKTAGRTRRKKDGDA